MIWIADLQNSEILARFKFKFESHPIIKTIE